MQTTSSLRKRLVVGIVLLFIGIAIAPGINVNLVKASLENNLVEVTTEVSGLKGFGTHTALLTTRQYNEVEHLIGTIKECLRRGITNEETVASIKGAVVTLNTYGLLPEGMSLGQAQKLVLGGYENSKGMALREQMLHEKSLRANQSNSFCFIAGIVYDGVVTGPLQLFGGVIAFIGLILKLNFLATVGLLLMGVSHFITTLSPVSFLQRVTIDVGNITSVGLGGVKNFNISLETGGGVISGFTGIKITRNDTGQITLLGVALGIKA